MVLDILLAFVAAACVVWLALKSMPVTTWSIWLVAAVAVLLIGAQAWRNGEVQSEIKRGVETLLALARKPKLSAPIRASIEAKLSNLIGKGDVAKSRYTDAYYALLRTPDDPAAQRNAVEAIRNINDWRRETGDYLNAKPFLPATTAYVLTQDDDLVTPQLVRLREVLRDLDRWVEASSP